MMKHILILSPFHGESSHAAWAEGLKQYSGHRVTILELDGQTWSWRLMGGALPLAEKMKELCHPVDLILATSLTCLSSLFGFLRHSPMASLPVVYYMHENQLTYPIRPDGRRDPQMVLRQFHSQLVADEVWFNSHHNMKSWFKKLPGFLGRFKDHQGLEHLEALQSRSRVVPLGLALQSGEPQLSADRPILLWNQRWVWEKGIDRLVGLIKKFEQPLPFDVVLLGQEVQDPLRMELEELLGPQLLHAGWCSRDEYWQWLSRSAFTVSVARHEFFGISVLEAAARGVMLFLPERLSYPEILPTELHQACLYTSARDLYRRVRDFLEAPQTYLETRHKLAAVAEGYRWQNKIALYDRELTRVLKTPTDNRTTSK